MVGSRYGAKCTSCYTLKYASKQRSVWILGHVQTAETSLKGDECDCTAVCVVLLPLEPGWLKGQKLQLLLLPRIARQIVQLEVFCALRRALRIDVHYFESPSLLQTMCKLLYWKMEGEWKGVTNFVLLLLHILPSNCCNLLAFY